MVHVAQTIILFAVLIWGGGTALAQVFNLRGNIDLNFGQTNVETDTSTTRSPSFLHRYNLGTFGSLGDARLGGYDANISYQEDIGKTDGVRTRDTDILDYRIGFNLLPRKTPVTFFAQRITRDNEVEPSTSRNRLDTYSLTWDLPLRRLPHLRMNLFQTDSKTTPSTTGLSRTQAASLEADQRFEATSVFARYQYSEQKSGVTPTTSAHNVNFNSESRLSPSLTLNTHGNYSNRSATLGVLNPQLSTFQQRSAGASLIHQPSLALNNRFTYDYFKDPFERHIFQGSSNYRATEKLDLLGSYRFLRFGLETALTHSHLATLGTTYRPILGVTTGLNLTATHTAVNAQTDTRTLSQNYNYFANYLRTFERIILNTGYNASYIRSTAEPGDLSSSLLNTLTLGVNNARPRIVSLGGTYIYNNTYTKRQSPSRSDALDQHTFRATAQSNYLRNLLLRGDLLTLTGSANYTLFETEETGTERAINSNETITYDTLRGITLSTGHSYEDTGGEATERHLLFGHFQWITFLLRNLHLTTSARESIELFPVAENITTFEGRAGLLYQLGRVSINADYTFTQQDQGDSRFRTQTFFVRASRPLF